MDTREFERSVPLGRYRYRWDHDIKVDFLSESVRVGRYPSDSVYGPLTAPCYHFNESTDFTEREFLECINGYSFLKVCFASCD